MDKQIVEISNDDFVLSLKRGFLVIENKERGIKHDIPLDNIMSLIISANNTVMSKNIINSICEYGGNIIFCGKNYVPVSITMPYEGHWMAGVCVKQQIDCSRPMQKKIWKSIVQHKIYNQAAVLKYFFPLNSNIERLRLLSKNILSDDTRNNEGIAAGIYFKAMFGKEFDRNRLNADVNLLLNYTYMVLRAIVARAVVGNGLLPQWGIKHCTRTNTMPLVDDLIEPFRALADKLVFEELERLVDIENIELTPEIKRRLSSIISMPLQTKKGEVSLTDAVQDFVASLAQSFEVKKIVLRYPDVDDALNKDD